jgi:hypothetical protein
LTPNLFISLMQSRNGVFIGIIWKVMYFKGVWTLIMPKEIAVPLLKRIIY